jgi:alkanesulfonate monooxygenase SsuD/methylene tetrahydromethanopterin reductase-like flavin-dependent oxidoreductase (luciferase family)
MGDMPALEIGITLPTTIGIDTLDALGGVGAAARHVEGVGLGSVWVPDVITGDGMASLEGVVALAGARR